MIPPFDLHVHTTFCDGKNTPEEMVLDAIARGMQTIGFSSHSPVDTEDKWYMSEEEIPLYCREIRRLKEKYGNEIRILMGIEQDFYSLPPREDYDYIIGSVHCLLLEGRLWAIDESPEKFEYICKRFFGGDFIWLAHAYFDLVKQLPQKTGCNIIGHFDLVSKFNEGNRFFDEHDPRYVLKAFKTLDELMDKNVIFEVNTGAVARGLRVSPYPPSWMLKYMADRGARITLSSDAHSRDDLQFLFELHADKLYRLGFPCCYVPDGRGWRQVTLDTGDVKA